MIKAVIFDMDGLLIDSEPLWEEVEKEVTNEIDVEYIHGETMGMRLDEVVDVWYRKNPREDFSKDQIIEKLIKEIIGLIHKKGKLMPGVEEVISFFQSRNIPMAIASSSYLDIINAVVEKFSLADKISFVYSAEYEEFGKPHPGVYISAARKFGFSPEDCLAFEDSPNGVLSAKSAKMRCIAVPTDIVKEDKVFLIADKVLNSLNEFDSRILDQLNMAS